jgi:hypothetical protein
MMHDGNRARRSNRLQNGQASPRIQHPSAGIAHHGRIYNIVNLALSDTQTSDVLY